MVYQCSSKKNQVVETTTAFELLGKIKRREGCFTKILGTFFLFNSFYILFQFVLHLVVVFFVFIFTFLSFIGYLFFLLFIISNAFIIEFDV